MARGRAGIDPERDEVEHDAIEHLVEIGQPVQHERIAAMVANGAARHQRKARGAFVQVGEDLGIGVGRRRLIGSLDDGPGCAGRPAGQRLRCRGARIERLDGQAVGGAADQRLVEGLALQNGVDRRTPVGLRGGGKFGGKSQGRGRCHGLSMPER